MKKYIIIGFIFLIIIFASIIGYRFYCESVINNIAEDFISIFSEGVTEEPKKKDIFYDLKLELYNRKDMTIYLLDKEIEEELSKIEYNPENAEDYLLWDTRLRTIGVAELLEHNGYCYSNGNTILLNDIIFSEKGHKGIIYNKVLIHLYQEDYPISYRKVIESSEYDFYFMHYEKGKGVYELYFTNSENDIVKINLYFSYLFKPSIEIYGLNI